MSTFEMNFSPLLAVDSYKFSHFDQYPEGTDFVTSYIEARGVTGHDWEDMVFFGLQGYLGSIEGRVIYPEDVEAWADFAEAHGVPFNKDDWAIIAKEHEGRLPIFIEALPEGSVVPIGTPLVQVSNTDSRFPWLTSFIETALLRSVWYPSTVATHSMQVKRKIMAALKQCCETPEEVVPFMLHDFGARGATSGEQAAIGGAAHLTSFMGTDTVEGIVWADAVYDAGMCGFSIAASEHSTMTAWGKDNELAAIENMIDKFGKPGSTFAVVSDSYNIYYAVEEYIGTRLHDKVVALGDIGARMVVRPDSGDPTTVPVEVLQILDKKFGSTVNSLGYKVLPPFIRVIQGDGMNEQSLVKLMENIMAAGFSVENVAFGMGGGLLQKHDRDTLKFAMKANQIEADGEVRDIYKDPVHGGKKSKRGQQAVIMKDGKPTAVRDPHGDAYTQENLFVPVFGNGDILDAYTFEDVRKRVAEGL